MKVFALTIVAIGIAAGCRGDASPGEEAASPARPTERPGNVASHKPTESALACNRDGLTPAERSESQQLLQRLGDAVSKVQDLPDGYALRLDEQRLSFADLAHWVDLEKRCCPFFHIAIEVTPGGETWLRLTGGAGVKDFIGSQMSAMGKAT